MTLLTFVWLCIAALYPGATHTGDVSALAPAIAWVVDHDALPDGWDKHQAAAALVEMCWEESRCRMHVIGPARCKGNDCGAYGPFQAEHRPDLANDPTAAVRQEYFLIRRGVRDCPDHPLALAVGGCVILGTKRPNRVAQSIADKRLLKSETLLDAAENWSE